MRILKLAVKKQYFYEIKLGIKKEEFRMIKDYWSKRLQKNYDEVHITLGYPKKDEINKILNTSKVKNYGEVTFLVIGMLNFIVNGQESIIQMLKDKILKLNYAEKYIDSIETSYSLSEIECNILFIYIQNYIFAKENPLPDKELLKYVKGIKSIQTLRRHLDNLTTLDLITLVAKKPLIRTISNTIKEVLD